MNNLLGRCGLIFIGGAVQRKLNEANIALWTTPPYVQTGLQHIDIIDRDWKRITCMHKL